MNSLLHRGVHKREQPMPCRQANDAEIGLFADLIGVDSPFSQKSDHDFGNWPVGWFFLQTLNQDLPKLTVAAMEISGIIGYVVWAWHPWPISSLRQVVKMPD